MDTTLNHRQCADVDNDTLFQELITHPKFSWPTFLLFLFAVSLAIVSITLVLTGRISYGLAIALNTLCSYIAYTTLHEASHGLVSLNRTVNEWVGRISMAFVVPTPFFRAYRFLHMTHHRFTNDSEKDPDINCGRGRKWTLPLRWLIMDSYYVLLYLKPGFYSSRPKDEQREFILSFVFAAAVLAVIAIEHWWMPLLLFYVLPTRIAIFFLAITFDYLPHYPHGPTAQENKYQSTSNRVGLEWLLTPVLLGQNYHLSHHLYPVAPFYRYRKIWRARQSFHESQHPAQVAFHKVRPALPNP